MTDVQAAVAIAALFTVLGTAETRQTPAAPIARPGVCQREGDEIVGRQPLSVGRGVRAPEKLRHVAPAFPALPSNTGARGVWMGEILIDTEGHGVRSSMRSKSGSSNLQ